MKIRCTLMALLLLLPLSVFVTPVQAQTPLKWNENGISWTASSVCADGSPAVNCPLTGFRVERAATPTATTWAAVATVGATINYYKDTVATAGQNCYRLIAISASGDSVPSANAPCKTNVAPKPGAPVVTDPIAYEYRPSTDVMARVGRVPKGIPCGPETKVVATITYCKLAIAQADLINWPSNQALTEVWARS